MNRFARVLVIVLAAGLLLGMGVHFDTQYDDRWPYPTTDAIEADDGVLVGQEVFVSGVVDRVDRAADTGRILVSTSDGPFEMTVRDFDAPVQQGGAVQVVGRLDSDHTIDARTVRVVNPSGSSTLFKYGVSLVGAALVTALVLRHWRIDPRTLSFEVRRDG